MSQAYQFVRGNLDSEWDEFVKKSPDVTIFSYSRYLECIDKPIGIFYCLKGQKKKAGLVLIESDDNHSSIHHSYVIYNGVFFSAMSADQNISTIRSEQFRITEASAEFLAQYYNKVSITLAPFIIDVRPFLWYNYGTNEPKFEPSIFYTSYVSLKEFKSKETLEYNPSFLRCSYSRRQEIRYGKRNGVFTKEEIEPDLFLDFYKMVMERQKKIVNENKLSEMKSLITSLITNNLGKIFISYTAEGKPGSVAFFGIDSKCAHYIFGSNDPGLRNAHTGTAVLWDAFSILSQNGICLVNLEGVNSPARGWFKLSFGGDLHPYYRLTFDSHRSV